MTFGKFNCEVFIEDNPLNLNVQEYFSVAKRNNPKRKFLFVSKVLGKHLACNPNTMDNVGHKLVEAFNLKFTNEDVKHTIISFAETATALGHSFFKYFNGNCEFIHSTREVLQGVTSLEFKEEHSHATDHYFYDYNNSLKYIKSNDDSRKIILVDDEITTGNTCINLIRQLHKAYGVKNFVIVSILNWMTLDHMAKVNQVEKEIGCKIDIIYLFKGTFKFTSEEEAPKDELNVKEEVVSRNLNVNYYKVNMDEYIYCQGKKYCAFTGRFGLDKGKQEKLINIIDRESAKLFNKIKENESVLVLGSEEFMYIPMEFARRINSDKVKYHSTTRSPIIARQVEGYPILSRMNFPSFYNKGIENYVYNLKENNYDKVYLFVELEQHKEWLERAASILQSAGIKEINIVLCS